MEEAETTGWLGRIGDYYYLDLVSVDQNALPDNGQGELKIISTAKGHAIAPSIVQVSRQLFLDFRPDQLDIAASDQSETIKFKIKPLHEIYRIKLDNDQLTIWHLDDENFSIQIEAGTIKLAHQTTPFKLITADTLELQEFLKTYSENEGLFCELGSYCRVIN